MVEFWNKPCAAKGLTSYRYKGLYGFIMIGATDDKDALKEANRSLSRGNVELFFLEKWNDKSGQYEPVLKTA